MRKDRPDELPRYVRRHGSGFRAVLRVHGRRHYGPTFKTAEEASAYADRFDDLRDQRATDAPEILTVQGACELLLADLRQSGARPDTLEYYGKYLKLFRRQWGDARPLHQVQHRDLVAYIAKREREVQPQTLYGKELQVAGRLFRLAIARGHLHRNPLAAIKAPRMRSERFEALGRDEVLAIVRRIEKSGKPQARFHADVVLLLFFTGLRLAELGRLRVRDYVQDGDAATLFVDGKTDNRHQPVPRVLRDSIDRLVAGKGPDEPMIGSGKRRLSSRILEIWKRRLGLPHFSAHVLRHSYATAMVRIGVDLPRVQAMMGHRSIIQTQRYLHAASPDLQDAADALGDRPPASRGTRARRAGASDRPAASRSRRGSPTP
jgi:site-specific recombinase XerD